VATSFFPNVNLDDIREIEFQFNMNFRSMPDIDTMDYHEFVWKYERLVQFRKDENKNNDNDEGRMSLGNLGSGLAGAMQQQG